MYKKILLSLCLGLIALVSPVKGVDEVPTDNPSMAIPTPKLKKPGLNKLDKESKLDRIYDLGGRYLVDGTLEATGALQADRYYETIAISTPSTPPTNHGRLYLDFSRRFCAKFDNGNALCFSATSSTSTFTTINAIDPIYYNSTTGDLYLSKISLSTYTVGVLDISTQTNLTASGSAALVGDNIHVGPISLSTGVLSPLNIASGTINTAYVTTLGFTNGTGSLQAINGGIGIFNNTSDIYFTGPTNGRVGLSGGSTFTIVSGSGDGYVGLRSSNSVSTTVWTLPRIGGSNHQVIETDSLNNLSFVSKDANLIISLSTGVMGILSISTQTNLTASGSASLTGSNIAVATIDISTGTNLTATGSANMNGDAVNVGPIKIGSGTLGAFDVSTTSASATGSGGEYVVYNLSAGSVTLRNIASGTQCVQADGSGNLTGTGSTCGSGSGDMILSSTQTVTGGKVFTSYVNHKGTTTTKGVIDGSDAAAGDIGQYISCTGDATTSASNTYGDLCSFTLTAGDWDVSGIIRWIGSGAIWSQVQTGITITSGNSGTGFSSGDNGAQDVWANSATTPTQVTQAVPVVRASLSGSTIYYLKYLSTYTSLGPPEAIGRMSARRVH